MPNFRNAYDVLKAGQKVQYIQGVGIHTGQPSKLTMKLQSEGKPGVVLLSHMGRIVLTAAGFSLHRIRCRHATILEDSNRRALMMPEHLLGLLSGFRHFPLEITLEGGELPGLDGSAKPFFNALVNTTAYQTLFQHVHHDIIPSKLKKSYSCPGGYFEVSPSECFEVHYEWQQGVCHQFYQLTLPSEKGQKKFLSEVLSARTFISVDDYIECKRGGLLKGAGRRSGILFAKTEDEYERGIRLKKIMRHKFPWVNLPSLRFNDECAAHKILDLMGDLSLLGLYLPGLKIKMKNSGHFQNHRLVEDIKHERRSKSI